MSSFACLNLYHINMCMVLRVWDQRGGFRDSRGRGGVSIIQDGAGDLQNGTGVERNRLRASQATTPSKDFLHWKIHPLQVKNTPHKCIMNVYIMAMNNYYLVVCCVICSYSLAEKMSL